MACRLWLRPGEHGFLLLAGPRGHLFGLDLYVAWPSALCAWILVRLGLLATVVAYTVVAFLALPITTDSSAFHFDNGLLAMGLVFAVALYGAFASLAGRPVFRDT